jgi:hypothetical protein
LNAGPSFAFYRTAYTLPHRAAAWTLLDERLHALADTARRACSHFGDHAAPQETLRRIEEKLRDAARMIEPHLDQMTAPAEP